jgi:hypothetical protein
MFVEDKEKAILSAIRAYNPETWRQFDTRRLKGALEHFDDDEFSEGHIAVNERIDDYGSNSGLWATNRRLLYIGFAGLFGKTRPDKVLVYWYGNISTIGFTMGKWGLFGPPPSITIDTSGSTTTYYVRKNPRLEELVDLIRTKIATVGLSEAQGPSRANASSLMAHLERLSQLREKGLITEEEFKAAKAKLLDLGI